MAIVAKEDFESYVTAGTRDERTITRVWFVEGPELEVVTGPGLALLATGIPTYDSLLTGLDGLVYQVTNLTSERHGKGPTLCKVEATYTWKRYAGPEREPPKVEQDRRKLYGVPYNEKLAISGVEEKLYRVLDANGNETDETIGYDGEGVTVHRPTAIWSFEVLFRPQVAFWADIGMCNNADYPPQFESWRHQRPFFFNTNTLLYLGAEGAISDRDKVYNPYSIPYDWVWNFTFKFAFKPDGWLYGSWTPSFEVSIELPDTVSYVDPGDGETKTKTVKKSATVYGMKEVGGVTVPYQYNKRIKVEANFTNDFDFNWAY